MVLAAGEIPPLVAADAVAVGIGPGAYSGVAGSGLSVGVIEVAVGKPGSMIEEEIEAACLEISPVPLEIVGAELVENENDDELRMVIVGSGARSGNIQERERANEGESGNPFELLHNDFSISGVQSSVQQSGKLKIYARFVICALQS